jgi:hypothetical protein
MKITASLAIGFIALIILSIYPHTIWAAGFNNSDFIKLNDIQKKFWIDGAMDTLGHVAAIKNKQQGQCVYDWYYLDTAKKNGLIIASINKYPDHTPSAILIALTEKACEKYVRN